MIVFVLVQVTFWAEPWTTWTGFCRCPTDAGSRTWRSSPPTSTSCSTWQTHSSWPKPSRTRPPTSWPAVSLRWLHVERVTNVPSLVLVLPVKWPLVVTFVRRCLFYFPSNFRRTKVNLLSGTGVYLQVTRDSWTTSIKTAPTAHSDQDPGTRGENNQIV